MKYFVQSETEGYTLFLFVLLLNSIYCTFNFVFQICQKRTVYVWIVYGDTFSGSWLNLTRLKNWSTLLIGVSYGTILTLSTRAEKEGKKIEERTWGLREKREPEDSARSTRDATKRERPRETNASPALRWEIFGDKLGEPPARRPSGRSPFARSSGA